MQPRSSIIELRLDFEYSEGKSNGGLDCKLTQGWPGCRLVEGFGRAPSGCGAYE
jgi:hypothetical protein